MDRAIKYLSRAAELGPNNAPTFLALGIAYQLRERWKEAVAALRRAIEIDPDCVAAYNSLGLTQKKCGELDKALDAYDWGARVLARRIAKGMQNSAANPILKHREETGTLWMGYAFYAATYCCALDKQITGVGFPTPEHASEEERTEKHAGLYWSDAPDNGETCRFFFPNYFNTFRDLLGRDDLYSNLVGNRAVVLELLGKQDEAGQHYAEAHAFSPRNAQVTDMFVLQEGERMVRAWINGVTKHSGPIEEPRNLGLMAVLDDCEERMADAGDVGRLAKALHAWALAEFELAYGADGVGEMQAARLSRG